MTRRKSKTPRRRTRKPTTQLTIISAVFDTAGAARYIDMKAPTLTTWRALGIGPAFIKIGRYVKYTRADLDAYIAAHRVDPNVR